MDLLITRADFVARVPDKFACEFGQTSRPDSLASCQMLHEYREVDN